MRILNVAYPFAAVGENAVGGAEQVLTHIAEALTDSNHDSFVLACAGSKLNASLFEVPLPAGIIDSMTRRDVHSQFCKKIEEIIPRCSIDLIHFHGVDFYEYIPNIDIPILATLHLPLSWYPECIYSLPATLQCVSASQRNSSARDLRPPISNGVPIERLRDFLPRRDFALCLGRICPEKGFHHGLAAAKRAGAACLLAGQIFPYESHFAYFTTCLVPLLQGNRRYVGAAGFAGKRKLLNSARCVLIPSTVPETSSLIAMEAMACGTPVIAFPVGALPEIIEHGKTGFLVRDEAEMAEAILASHTVEPTVCKEMAKRRFDVGQMTDRYLTTYEQLIRNRRVSGPRTSQEVYEVA